MTVGMSKSRMASTPIFRRVQFGGLTFIRVYVKCCRFMTDKQTMLVTPTIQYKWDEEHAFTIPYHMECYRLLKEIISHQLRAEQDIDDEVLHYTMKTFALDAGQRSIQALPHVNYGDIRECQKQVWEPRQGTEAFVTIPSQSQSLPLIIRNCLY